MDAFQELRTEVETITSDPELRPGERTVKLRRIGTQLASLQGMVASAQGDQRLMEEASAAGSTRRILALRANADVRDRLISQGHDADELAGLGFQSHEELDNLAEEGLLEEVAASFDMGGRPRE